MKKEAFPSWFRNRGYLHITPQIDVNKQPNQIRNKIFNPKFVAKYSFYPLIHSNISDRKYKKTLLQANPPRTERTHSYKDENGIYKKNIKTRPLHYATHMDALILGYYAEVLQKMYEDELKKHNGLSDCVTAYRKIPIENEINRNKGNIHFADEVFEEIKKRASEEISVLTFDIKGFFSSLNHTILKDAWQNLLNVERLPDDHFNVFKASTLFSYILLDELRVFENKNGRKAGFNEEKLAEIRNKKGVNCFFESSKEFRQKVRNKEVKIYKFPFWDRVEKKPIGIPQGLPISAVLANLYLLEFDIDILNRLVKKEECFYRRYSDDIIIICKRHQINNIKEFVYGSIERYKLSVSKEKTEEFLFKRFQKLGESPELKCIKITDDRCQIGAPINYLGFEFFGNRKAIKSTNLAKFYRRMIKTVRSKAKIALKLANKMPETPPIIFRRQLYRIYTLQNLKKTNLRTRGKRIIKKERGDFYLKSTVTSKRFRGNYLSYIDRASDIMKEPSIKLQIRKHKKIFNDTLYKHFYSKLSSKEDSLNYS